MNPSIEFKRYSFKKMGLVFLLLVFTFLFTASFSFAQNQAAKQPSMQEVQKIMKGMLKIMTPPMQQKTKKLSKKTKMSLAKIYKQHTRHSKTLTLRQVMHEVLADYQTMVAGILVDNGAQAADAARRLANHRIPRGGLLPYMKLADVNDDKLGVLVPMNDLVEGNTLRFADAAERGDFNAAAGYLSKITNGCISCHQIFRGQPGTTDHLVK